MKKGYPRVAFLHFTGFYFTGELGLFAKLLARLKQLNLIQFKVKPNPIQSA
jgi:hypothetical protein